MHNYCPCLYSYIATILLLYDYNCYLHAICCYCNIGKTTICLNFSALVLRSSNVYHPVHSLHVEGDLICIQVTIPSHDEEKTMFVPWHRKTCTMPETLSVGATSTPFVFFGNAHTYEEPGISLPRVIPNLILSPMRTINESTKGEDSFQLNMLTLLVETAWSNFVNFQRGSI